MPDFYRGNVCLQAKWFEGREGSAVTPLFGVKGIATQQTKAIAGFCLPKERARKAMAARVGVG
jgi:hypothetical protein